MRLEGYALGDTIKGGFAEVYLIILGSLVICMMTGFYWVLERWLLAYGICVKNKRMRLLRIAGSVLAVALCSLWRTFGLIIIHLTALSLLAECIAIVIQRAAGKYKGKSWYRRILIFCRGGVLPGLLTCLLLGYGAWNMTHIVETEYTVVSNKLQSDYEVVLLTDTHYGTIQNPDVLKRKIEEINALQPDLIILGGDIVEEGTSKEAMQEAFSVLGDLKSTYGTFYIYGNHDRQHYIENRTYSDEELAHSLEGNGITVLSDQWVILGDELVLAGREDADRPEGRASLEKLLEEVDKSRFLIVADHQPIETEENAALGVDLEVSGHTHAGQMFPMGYISELLGTRNYGEYQEDTCRVIVSSGAAGWGFPIRTQKRCEYVVIHLR